MFPDPNLLIIDPRRKWDFWDYAAQIAAVLLVCCATVIAGFGLLLHGLFRSKKRVSA